MLLTVSHLAAQNYCHSTEKQIAWFTKHPELKVDFEKHQQKLADLDKELYKNNYQMAGKSAVAGNYTIPVVFHILYNSAGGNISDAQVIDAVNILTRDYNAANADTSNVVVQFKHDIGNTQFDFKLATKDPNGNCTNGIIRHYDNNTNWGDGPDSNYAYTWPPTSYLNIYVVTSMFAGAAAYTYLPGSGIPPAMDAIVCLNSYVGSIGTGNIFTSRVLTHEVGHWFDLDHVWGGTNQPGVACGDDGVSDTPVTKGYTTCNLPNAAICTPGIVENVQNYMEYSYCDRMFTIGQSARMQTCINSPVNGRDNLSTPANLALTGITSPGTGCIPEIHLVALPALIACSGRTITVSGFTYNAVPTSYLWSADNSAVISNPTATSATVFFNAAGATHISCQVSNGNGSNSQTITVVVANSTPQITAPTFESFEGSTLAPPAQWKLSGTNMPTEKWMVKTALGSDGTVCMYAPGEMLSQNSIVILESPSYDFKHNPGTQFSFKYAYAMNGLNNKDVFKVQASKNCGATWVDVWSPSNTYLAQNTGGVTSTLYYPQQSHWKLKNVTQQPQFYPFISEENVLIRFYFQENVDGFFSGGNRFYLDGVDFSGGTVGINELTKAVEFNVYPNPANAAFNLSFQLSDAAKIKYQVTSITGAVLISEYEKTYSEGAHVFTINADSQLSAGIYFINVELNGVKISRKIIIE